MALLDMVRLFSSRQKKIVSPVTKYAVGEQVQVSDFGGTRSTIPKFVQGGGGVFGALPRRTQADLNLDERRMNRMTVEDLMDILIDAHPDVSYALWNFLRLGNGEYTLKALRVGSDAELTRGTKVLNEFIKKLDYPNVERFEHSRSFSKVLNELLLSTVVRGAAACELVLSSGIDDVAFIATVDPATVSFLYENDRYVPYQDQERISLDIPTFIYEALDTHADSPYGRSPFLAAVQMVLFQLQILNDIKAVVHNQGYPRLDIKILEEVLLKRMPLAIRNNEEKKQQWLNDHLQQIIAMYNNLGPDDTFVHYNSIEMDMVGGSSGGGAMLDPQKLMDAVDSLVMSGLKTLSTILGRRSHGNTESFAKMEIKLFIKSVEAVQKVVERLMNRALTMVLNLKGLQGVAQFRFKPVEIRTAQEQAQFELIAFQNAAYLRDQGWIDQEEAAMRAVGHAPAAEAPLQSTEQDDGSAGTTDEKGPDSPTEDAGV